MDKKLHRSSNNRMIFGVFGGIAEYFKIDPTIIRLVWVLILIFLAISRRFFVALFGGVIFYVIAAFIIPENAQSD